jgi:polysaccharide export outer membrane protein
MQSGTSATQVACVLLTLGLGSAMMAAQSATTPAPDQPSVQASVPATPASEPANPTLKISPDKVLKAFEPDINEEYTLGAGDDISIDFAGRPELGVASKQTVGPDGRITLPLAGPIHVADLTREQAGKAVTDALASYYTNLSVTVRVDKYSSNRVRVVGYVQHPGEVLFEGTPTLLDAIGKAGLLSTGKTVSKDGTVTEGGASAIPETCTIYRGNDQAVQVQLRTLLTSGNSLADMRLRRNDVVYVPEPKQLFVSVMGQVGKPGAILLTPESTLTSILAEAGCCNDQGGYNPKIHILQPSTGKDMIVEYKKVMTLAGQKEYTLHSGDVIIVPTSGFNKVAAVMQKISPVATMVSLAAITGVL